MWIFRSGKFCNPRRLFRGVTGHAWKFSLQHVCNADQCDLSYCFFQLQLIKDIILHITVTVTIDETFQLQLQLVMKTF